MKVLKYLLQLQCCGIEGPRDWDRNNYFNCSSRDVGSREACGVPFSCCKRKPNVSTYLKTIIRELYTLVKKTVYYLWDKVNIRVSDLSAVLYLFPSCLTTQIVWCLAPSTPGCQHCTKVTSYHSHKCGFGHITDKLY
jgi:hypothetical protein